MPFTLCQICAEFWSHRNNLQPSSDYKTLILYTSQIESTSFNQFSNEIHDSHLSKTDAQQDKYNQQNHLTHFNYTVLGAYAGSIFVDGLASSISHPVHMYNVRTTTILPTLLTFIFSSFKPTPTHSQLISTYSHTFIVLHIVLLIYLSIYEMNIIKATFRISTATRRKTRQSCGKLCEPCEE